MNKTLPTLIRWGAILLFALTGVWILVVLSYSVAQDTTDWASGILGSGLTLLSAGLPLLIAYVLFKREYRSLIGIAGTLSGIAVFFLLISLPSRLNLIGYMNSLELKEPWMVFAALACSLLMLGLPFVAAAWTFRLFRRLERWFENRMELRAGRRL